MGVRRCTVPPLAGLFSLGAASGLFSGFSCGIQSKRMDNLIWTSGGWSMYDPILPSLSHVVRPNDVQRQALRGPRAGPET